MPPFAKIVVPAVVGIVAARAMAVPVWVAVACAAAIFLVAAGLTWRERHCGKGGGGIERHDVASDSETGRRGTVVSGRGAESGWLTSVYVWFAVAVFFFAVVTVRRSRAQVVQGERIEMAAHIVEHPAVRGRWQSATAVVSHWRPIHETDWHRVRERVVLNVDTCYAVALGDRLTFRGYLNPLARTASDSIPSSAASAGYARLMALRGIFGRTYLVPGNMTGHSPGRATPAARLQTWAVERLSRLRLDSAQMAVTVAMSVGWRGGIDRELRGAYSATGASHLLAVSGLHVGIVFVLVNALIFSLLWLLTQALPNPEWLLRHSLGVRCWLAVATIWVYAVAAGLAPSVVRAALMFSLAQWALGSGSRRDALNILLGSAVVMLAVNPNWWGDVGFMLSFAAVLSIVAFFQPLYSRLRTPWRAVNALISIVLVGLAASIGTAPLVALYFGRVPIVGLLINPAVVLTAHVIVSFGVLWVVAPVWTEGFSAVLRWAASTQNAIVEWSAERSWAAVDVGHVPPWAVVTAYACLGFLAVWAGRHPASTRNRVKK